MIPLGIMAAQSPPDLVPNAFSFTDQSGLARATLVYSNIIQIGGLTGAAAVSCTGGQVCTFSDAGGTLPISGWTTSTTITNGQYIRARVTTSSSWATAANCAVTIGGVSDTFTATTNTVSAGSVAYTTPGVYTFVVPRHTSMTVYCRGGGGGGGGWTYSYSGGSYPGNDGSPGGHSYFNYTQYAYGGGGGAKAYYDPGGAQYNGAAGAAGSIANYDGGTVGGGSPGGTGMGWFSLRGGAGGAGGYMYKSFGGFTLMEGTSITVVVGAGGGRGTSSYPPDFESTAGSNGRVDIVWS